MQTLPVVMCPGCNRTLQIEVGDIRPLRHLPHYYDAFCHKCGGQIRLKADVVKEIFPEEEFLLPERAGRERTGKDLKKELDLATEANEALRVNNGSIPKAAKAMGLTQKELRDRLKSLPVVTESEA